MAKETAWLIENSRGALCLGLCGGELAWVDFSDPDALRFARQKDGLRMRSFFSRKIFTHIAGSDLRAANVNEHIWCDAPGDMTVVDKWNAMTPAERIDAVSREYNQPTENDL